MVTIYGSNPIQDCYMMSKEILWVPYLEHVISVTESWLKMRDKSYKTDWSKHKKWKLLVLWQEELPMILTIFFPGYLDFPNWPSAILTILKKLKKKFFRSKKGLDFFGVWR